MEFTGGFFHFSGEYGLAADNAKNFEVSAFLSPTLLLANPRRRLSWQTAPLRMQTQKKTVTSSGLSKVVAQTSVRPLIPAFWRNAILTFDRYCHPVWPLYDSSESRLVSGRDIYGWPSPCYSGRVCPMADKRCFRPEVDCSSHYWTRDNHTGIDLLRRRRQASGLCSVLRPGSSCGGGTSNKWHGEDPHWHTGKHIFPSAGAVSYPWTAIAC